MASPAKKRDLADFFRPYARHKTSPAQVIPQKRPSPSAESEALTKAKPEPQLEETIVRKISLNTPSKDQCNQTLASPIVSPPSLFRSGTLPIRSPHSRFSVTPASHYKNARLFGTSERARSPQLPLKQPATFSFVDLPATTKPVGEDRKAIVIKDSDDDSDSLHSLGDLFGGNWDNQPTSSSSPPEPDEDGIELQRKLLLGRFTGGRSEPLVGKERLRNLQAKAKAVVFDITDVLGDHLEDAESDARVKKSRAKNDASMQELEAVRRAQQDRDLLVSYMRNEDIDDEGMARLRGALERTEALSSDKSFSFLGHSQFRDGQIEDHATLKFPESSIPHTLWSHGDDAAISRAYLSGVMSEFAAARQLDDQALRWTFRSLMKTSSDDLRQKYLECLRQGSAMWTRTNLTAQDVQTCFQILGADPETLRDGLDIEPTYQSVRRQQRYDPTRLICILEFFASACQDMDFSALSKLASILCRIALDMELMADGRVSCKVESCLEAILSLPGKESQMHVCERIQTDMEQHLHDPVLQAQLLLHIPPVSSITTKLRIDLALIFLLGPDTANNDCLSTSNCLKALRKHVSTSHTFNTSRHSKDNPIDYTDLKARTQILDIAIGSGHSHYPDPSQTAGTKAFNKSIDSLADALHARIVAIVDAGASHLRRTECKNVMQALYRRLLYSVRTEVRLKKHIFDVSTETGKTQIKDVDDVRSEVRGRDFMRQFLTREQEQKQQQQETVLDTTQNGDIVAAAQMGLSLSQVSQPSENEVLIRKQLQLG